MYIKIFNHKGNQTKRSVLLCEGTAWKIHVRAQSGLQSQQAAALVHYESNDPGEGSGISSQKE